MLKTLTTNWNTLRVIRLVLAIFIAFQAIDTQDPLAGIIAGLLFFQVISNTGCCGTACRYESDTKDEPEKEVEFIELKSK